ncbi:Threonine-phosphate decarboxylase [Hyphomicrobium sp. 1Nfss2.1]|uniref:threonine-phosphate decarboxylase CobD n=1 Tax=Hyphomicrobium sp. 1Nfss2.1 TaxID=3413936 RepID=UPI003C7980AB
MTAGRIEPVDHGGDLDTARRRYPGAQLPWIDLSTGINPRPYPFTMPPMEAWTQLPQRSAELALRQAAADRYGAPGVEMVVSAPGSQALIQVLPRLIDPADVTVLAPTYAEHAIAWARCGHRVSERSAIDDVGAARVVVVVNPNNPTGAIVSTDALCELASALETRRGLLVVDEAFADFAPEASLVSRLPERCIVLRSLGKAYGLGGVRAGFAIAQPTLAEELRAEIGPWAVSGPALAIGRAALADVDWLSAAKARLTEDCQRLDAMLKAIGITLIGGTHLFRLVRHDDAAIIADRLGRNGIIVRRFAAQPTWLRFGLPGSEDAWKRLSSALKD